MGLMHESFVTSAPPPTGKGGGGGGGGGRVCRFSFQCPAICPTPRKQTGGQNFALCPTLSNRKSP